MKISLSETLLKNILKDYFKEVIPNGADFNFKVNSSNSEDFIEIFIGFSEKKDFALSTEHCLYKAILEDELNKRNNFIAENFKRGVIID